VASRTKSKQGTKKKRPPKKKKAAAKPVAIAAKPLESAATPGAPPKSLKDLGPPPDDPLAQQAYLYKMLVLSAADVANDGDLSPRERRKELRVISAAAQKLMPRSRLHQAEQLVLQNKDDLEKKARDRRGAKLEKLPKRAPVVEHVEEPQP
jgi:hypothetical protein